MKLSKNIVIDMSSTSPGEVFRIHQNDVNSAEILIALNDDGTPLDAGGCEVSYDVSVNNILLVENASGEVRGGKPVIPVTREMTRLSGAMCIDVRLVENGEVTHTRTVNGYVERAVIDGSTVIDLSGLTVNQRFEQLEARIDGISGVDPDDYYTKSEIDSIIGTGRLSSYIDSHSRTGDDVNFPSVNAVRNYAKMVIDDWGEVMEEEINDAYDSIPTATSQLNNDSGFLTEHQSLDNYYTKAEVDALIRAAAGQG